jgi:hypothetical protein
MRVVILSGAKDPAYKDCGTLGWSVIPSPRGRFLASLGMTLLGMNAQRLSASNFPPAK